MTIVDRMVFILVIGGGIWWGYSLNAELHECKAQYTNLASSTIEHAKHIEAELKNISNQLKSKKPACRPVDPVPDKKPTPVPEPEKKPDPSPTPPFNPGKPGCDINLNPKQHFQKYQADTVTPNGKIDLSSVEWHVFHEEEYIIYYVEDGSRWRTRFYKNRDGTYKFSFPVQIPG